MKKKKTVLLIKGVSQYNSMRNYLDEIAQGFTQIGYQPIVLDGEDPTFQQTFEFVVKNYTIDYVFTCNVTFYSYYEKISGARYITYLCDHPSQHRERLKKLNKNAVVFACDLFHVEYIKKYYSNISQVYFIPTSGSYSQIYVPYFKRKYDVVFTGSYVEPQELYQTIMGQFEGTLKIFVECMMTQMRMHSDYTIEKCLKEVLEINKINVSDSEFDELVSDFWVVSYYARFYYRDKVLHALTEHGIKVHVYGKGWEKYKSKYKENLIWEKGDELVAREAVANAKISLNVQPWFKAGFQERIASAMLSGTIALTDQSVYISDNFRDDEICTYSLKKIEELPEKVNFILKNEDIAGKIAENGRLHAEKELSWQVLTKKMAEYLENRREKDEF